MVVTVDVGPDRPAHRAVPVAGQHRQEPAERQQHRQQPVQAHPRVAHHESGPGVDGADPVQPRHVEHGTPGVLRRVAVRPAQAAGDRAARPAAAHRGDRLLVTTGVEAQGGRRGGAAPAGQGHGVDRHEGDRIARENTFEGFVTTLTEMGDCGGVITPAAHRRSVLGAGEGASCCLRGVYE